MCSIRWQRQVQKNYKESMLFIISPELCWCQNSDRKKSCGLSLGNNNKFVLRGKEYD